MILFRYLENILISWYENMSLFESIHKNSVVSRAFNVYDLVECMVRCLNSFLSNFILNQ